MRLEFRRRHLSITGFPTIELQPLTIIVGINGSGKTHLLQAIQNGAVHNSVSPISEMGGQLQPSSPIRLLSSISTNVTPQPGDNSGPIAVTTYNSQMQTEIAEEPGLVFEAHRKTILNPFVSPLEVALGQPLSSVVNENEDPWRLGANELVRRADKNSNPAEIAKVFASATEALKGQQSHSFSGITPEQLRPATAMSDRLGIPLLSVTKEQIGQFQQWSTDQFHFNLATLFGRYRDRYLGNELQRLQDRNEGTSKALSEEDFLKAFGPPPWTSLNETFMAFRLPYDASAPELYKFTPISFTLRKKNGGEQVHPSNLSSGERVLLQFAISSFQHDDGMTNITRPTLLLLDELDAPLHPEMVHRWLGAISEGLVGDQGIHCILTTHSPTTVALAPEAALYEMRDGSSGLKKISKQDALNTLTFGVPTLSIDYSGRRQVFTESDTDAAIYERVYSIIKSELSCERELNFLSTGMRTKDAGEINSGCTIVKKIVQNLREAGNKTVYGIVDWDGEAESGDHVKVIAEGTRDGIESILLDPLLVCLLLMKERCAPAGLEDIDRFVGASSLEASELQRMVDAVQCAVFPASTSERVAMAFIGGATTSVLREYLTANDHDLEAALAEAFPALNKWYKKGRGELVKGVVEAVLTEHRTFCPMEMKTVFEAIANAPA
jgi:energy-coupling factor transporter ATP-binding protein EcfA2